MSDLIWCRLDYSEYPPEDVLVWSTDGHEVRKGRWTFPGIGIPLEEGKWEDDSGEPIKVTQWIPIEESPDSPPTPPPPRPPGRGGIVGFRTTDED